MFEHYAYRVVWSGEDKEWVGLCTEFPSLSHLDPDAGEALRGIQQLIADVVADMRVEGEAVPEPIAARAYSGKLATRVPPAVHRMLVMEAAEAGVSINRVVSLKLATPLREASPRPVHPAAPRARRAAKAKTDSECELCAPL